MSVFLFLCICFLFIVDLSAAITPESLQAVLSDPSRVRDLQQHLPSVGSQGNQQEQLRSTLASPQFQQVIKLLFFLFS